jgi:adenosylhomocysteine nucleosidase
MRAMDASSGRLAIVSAMTEEWQGLHDHVQVSRTAVRAGREFCLGRLGTREVVLVLSGIGKVAAATTATLLLAEFDVREIVFTGVAGGLAPGVQVGDIVIADALLQHDMDASPLFPRHEVPLRGVSRFSSDGALSNALTAAARACLPEVRQHRGLVVSGDRFVSSAAESSALRAELPDALAVEMEGAAVAQVCHDFGVPLAVLRTISDRADDDAHVDFSRFIQDVARRYTVEIVRALLRA